MMNQPGASSPGASISVRPTFLQAAGGRLFAVHHVPASPRGNVLCIPPFNEEMNRCRSMLTLLAQSLAAQGYGTLVIDLFGTGDSDGNYVDARWDRWQRDISTGQEWLDAHGGCSALLGIRMGVLLAAEWLRANTDGCRPMVAWQPVVDGKQYLTQFLRMRIAANLDRTDLPKETTTSMRNTLAAGTSVEVAGYEIHPALAQAIDSRSLLDAVPPAGTRVAWLEHRTGMAELPGPASAKAIDAWRAGGVGVDLIGFEGEAFWQLHERSLALDAIARTTEWLKRAGTPE